MLAGQQKALTERFIAFRLKTNTKTNAIKCQVGNTGLTVQFAEWTVMFEQQRELSTVPCPLKCSFMNRPNQSSPQDAAALHHFWKFNEYAPIRNVFSVSFLFILFYNRWDTARLRTNINNITSNKQCVVISLDSRQYCKVSFKR